VRSSGRLVVTALLVVGACSNSTTGPPTVAATPTESVTAATQPPATRDVDEDGVIVLDPADEFDDIMGYLSGKVADVASERQAYWKRDFASVDDYEAALEPYRIDYRTLIGVPDACIGAGDPRLARDALLPGRVGFELRVWEMSVCDGRLTSFLLVGSPSSPPRAAVVALAGTCGSPERVMGLQGEDYHHSFGARLVDAGFLVVSPLISTRPTTDGVECVNPTNQERNQLDLRALPLGDRLIGIEVGKLMGVSRFLEMKGFDDLGIYGISLGGELSLATAASDTRYDVAVVSQWIEDRTGKLVGLNHPSAYWQYEDADYVFFANELGLFTDVDVASLIAPRKLFIEAGSEDPRSESVEDVFSDLAVFWDRLGLRDGEVSFAIEDGGHEVFLGESLRFLEKWLLG
jgi:hypothetical protein